MKSLVISNQHQTSWLERQALGDAVSGKSEKWLQQLLFENPDLVPMNDLHPGSSGLIPICRELSIPNGGRSVFLDLMGVTAEGQLVLIECKLWRNPQARREVIAQILEYAALLRKWSYGDLTVKVKKSTGSQHPNPLYDLASKRRPNINEAVFVDRISDTLKRGDFTLIIAGDGIRTDVQAIAEHLNRSSGLTSKLALVEFQLWHSTDGHTIIIPAIPVRTEILQHRVVVDQSGYPLLSDPAEEIADTPLSDQTTESSAKKEADRAFWQTIIDQMRFDHPDQIKPRHGGQNNIRIPMPDPVGWITAYRTKTGEGGIFFTLKGDEGERLYNDIELAKETIEAEIGLGFIQSQRTSIPFSGEVTWHYANDASDEPEFTKWLLDVANRLVGVVRPMLNTLGE
ncbi:hypothetical protein [Cohaesibacter haloalkalitolerans]|uniref:hypothetical protein n=1 Tax=Cohaesibacter haloalkalitolerans TaxID=1162980 RepID=UPI0013C3FA7E|nr:hypothetical protein [Cohaesibacter haloalkalitolerans]